MPFGKVLINTVNSRLFCNVYLMQGQNLASTTQSKRWLLLLMAVFKSFRVYNAGCLLYKILIAACTLVLHNV